jgi:hypothetical protein
MQATIRQGRSTQIGLDDCGAMRKRFEGMLDMSQHLVPYEGHPPLEALPASVDSFPLQPCEVINGYRMTLRRKFGIKTKWTEALFYYAHEDGDFCYRVSALGAVAMACDSLLSHAQSSAGRL